ncbi:MAG: hypothetical protein VSS75_008265 [Candidatus Parabeggiatoa sp.]|nr:hypothetical protein [Candidatus Parabeggiatoa sp.]
MKPETENNTKKSEEDSGILIADIERAAYQRDYDTVFHLLFRIFDKSERKSGGILLDKDTDLDDHDYFLRGYTRLASALSSMFAHPEFQMLTPGFMQLNVYKKQLAGIFELSGFRGTDHLLGLIGEKASEQDAKTEFAIKNEQQLLKFLTFYSLQSEPDVDFGAFLKSVPHLALSSYINLVSTPVVLTKRASARREKLLELGPLLEDIALNEDLISRLSALWMLCSYAEGKNKHDIKKHLNVVLQRWLVKKGIKVPALPDKRELKERPILLIASEHFTAGHAMFRCYAPVIKQLRDKFQMVLISAPKNMDDISKNLFDQVIEVNLEEGQIKKEVVGKMIKLKPDIIFYPSLGMAQWTLFVANLRLAPIQLMSMGHPGTSNSPFIDYAIMPESAYSKERDCFSEKLLLTKDNTFQFVAPLQSFRIKPRLRLKPSPVKLAVTSKFYKLSASFMATCQRISEKSQRPVEFQFFPNDAGMVYQQVRHQIHQWVPDAIVHKMGDYNLYIHYLNQCDIHLSTFPFGGSNSNVDSMRQGIPIVTLAGDQPHSRTDLWFFALSQSLPKWLIAQNEEEYVDIAIRLIENDDERVKISQDLLQENFDKVFLDAGYEHHKEQEKDFVNFLWWLYEHHDEIQKDGKKAWFLSEIEALNA